jgi:glycine betaine/proline transport system ATP-binding protein
MKDGSFMQVGTPEDIVAAPADPYVASFTQDVDRGRVVTAQRIMRPAETISEAALARADAPGQLHGAADGALFVVDAKERTVGLLLARDLAEPADPGAAMRRSFPTTSRATKLCELFETCAQGLPIVVVGDEDRVVGAVHPEDVFFELARQSEVDESSSGPAIHEAEPHAAPNAWEAAHV